MASDSDFNVRWGSNPRTFLAVLTCGVAVFALGVALPHLLIGDGVERYEGEERAFAEYALLYDLDLKEWPFPIDPTVTRRVTEVRSRPGGGECRIDVDAYPAVWDDPDVTVDRSAEVVHYGPFFVPTGKNVFRCDNALTSRYLEPKDVDGALFAAYGYGLVFWVLFVLLAVPAVPGTLLIGGTLLWRRGEGKADRVVGLAALTEGTILLATVAYYIYVTHRFYWPNGL